MKWTQLTPDEEFLDALKHAGTRSEVSTQDAKRHWSERFADACAVLIAAQLSAQVPIKKSVKPLDLDAGTEPLTPLGAGTSKRIDVTVTDPMLGLEIGVSLKGLNFQDARSLNYDKNLTGRLYELGDEVRLVHEHLPNAFMVGVFFLPISSALDKTDRAPSSFANTVMKLRSRTGRIDPALAAHAARCDASFVALYSNGEEPQSSGLSPGICRFFDTTQPPPRRGRPRVEDTITVTELAKRIVDAATFSANVEWGLSDED